GFTSTDANKDVVTIRYSSTGVPLWTNYYDGPVDSSDSPIAIAVDASGKVFVTARSSDASDRNSFLTLAYSNSGTPIWTNRYEGGESATPRAMVIDGSGNIIVTGHATNPTNAT